MSQVRTFRQGVNKYKKLYDCRRSGIKKIKCFHKSKIRILTEMNSKQGTCSTSIILSSDRNGVIL